MDSDLDGNQQRLDRLDIGDAAARLGLSIDAVRKRVQRGTLPAEKVAGRWLVVLPLRSTLDDVLDGDQPASRTDAKEHRDTSKTAMDGGQVLAGQAIIALAEVFAKTLDAERERASRAEQAAAMWQERSRNLETENAKLQELLALPAYEETEAPRRRWWQRWRGGRGVAAGMDGARGHG